MPSPCSAEAVLDQAVQSYRNRNASGLIERAGEYFCTLTGGSFTGLDLDDATLVCVRPEGIRPRTLPIGRGQGLSEGCYDQLFLALRLAFLQDQVARNGPLPIIFDDILLTFDDRRATAALECMVRMAAQTQVLLFTHHRHLGELAKASPSRRQDCDNAYMTTTCFTITAMVIHEPSSSTGRPFR